MDKHSLPRRTAFLFGVAAHAVVDKSGYLREVRGSASARRGFRWMLFGALSVLALSVALFVSAGTAIAGQRWLLAALLFALGMFWYFIAPLWAMRSESVRTAVQRN